MDLLPKIKEMQAAGMTQKEIESALETTGYRPVHELLNLERKKEPAGVTKTVRKKTSENPAII